ncbi:MAG: OmpA family protein, partial [Thermodesulfobacteriota bacterium]
MAPRWIIALSILIADPSLLLAGTEDDLSIPASAHDKAVEAVKALGPDRGGKSVGFRVVNIIGGGVREIKFDAAQLKKAIRDLGAKETPTEIRIELSSDVMFDFDKAEIRPDAEASLNTVAGVIKGFKSPAVMVFGHTDSKGADDYNLKLSRRRADSVKNWLVKNGGIEERIIQTIGFGKSKPKAP